MIPLHLLDLSTELAEANPPAYTRYFGDTLQRHLRRPSGAA